MASRLEFSRAVADRTDIVAQWKTYIAPSAEEQIGPDIIIPRDQVERYVWIAGHAPMGYSAGGPSGFSRDWYCRALLRFLDDNENVCEIPMINWSYLSSISTPEPEIAASPGAVAFEFAGQWNMQTVNAGTQPPIILRTSEIAESYPAVAPCLKMRFRATRAQFFVKRITFGVSYDVRFPVYCGFAVMSMYP